MMKKILALSPSLLFGGLFVVTIASLHGFDDSAIRILHWMSSAGFIACAYVVASELSRKTNDLRFKINIILIVGCVSVSTTTLLSQLKLMSYGEYIYSLVWVEGVTVATITTLLWLKSLLNSRKQMRGGK